jgi:pimeloyl-ACP methyl ester carboxylesterase
LEYGAGGFIKFYIKKFQNKILQNRMSMPSKGLVIVLHGIACTAWFMRAVTKTLEKSGYSVLAIDYPSTKLQMADCVAQVILPQVQAAVVRTAHPVHFVGYSMGGLLIRQLLALYRPQTLGRVVMLGTPHHGSEVADFLVKYPVIRHLYCQFFGPAGAGLTTTAIKQHFQQPVDYPLGIIAGNRFWNVLSGYCLLPRPNDGKVSVASTKLFGMADHCVLPTSHTGMVYHPAVLRQMVCFLEEGQFKI